MSGLLHSLLTGAPPPGDPRDVVSVVYLLLWAYIIGSIALLLGVRRLFKVRHTRGLNVGLNLGNP